MMECEKLTQLTPVASFIQASFWNKFTELKINEYKLNENDVNIWGYITIGSNWNLPIVEVDSTCFNLDFNNQNTIPYHGKILNKNTLEQFKNIDKNKLIYEQGVKLFELIRNGDVYKLPSLLNNFLILSYSDLKKYHFYYWFAFPVPNHLKFELKQSNDLSTSFNCPKLAEEYWKLDVHQRSYFLIHQSKISTLSAKLCEINEANYGDFYFVSSETTNHLRPQLKNFIIFLLYHCSFLGGKVINYVTFIIDKNLTCTNSKIYKLHLPDIEINHERIDELLWSGWEKNENNKFGPRFSNMKTMMDPQILFEESVDLNLKLMKWRLVPDLDLEKIKNCKCLLLGTGTLGCSVARTLLSWGVRNITLVDNSTVSYSNPVRQSLFTYEDAINAKPKSRAAVENLKKIFPSINSKGYQLTIPMPGHCVDSKDSFKSTVEQLEQLFKEHDLIFLLTDSRESRWLPTLFGAIYDKMVINVALGFDTYLIMRHGGVGCNDDNLSEKPIPPAGFQAIAGRNLGCYFCNDVTAPGNSFIDRTLDQQCTVTRPGISSIAGSLAVELAASLLQHTEGINAPAFYKLSSNYDFNDIESQTILGILPHSIRGFLSNFTQVQPATPRFDKCIACSSVVLNEYKTRNFDFLYQVFTNSQYLEDLTGLSQLQDDKNYTDIIEVSDNEDWIS